MSETLAERAARLAGGTSESLSARAARLANPAPTEHAGKPFVDAKPDTEPGWLEQATGGVASLGRFVAGDMQAGARAMTRDRGILDFVKELKNTKGDDVLNAVRGGPFGMAKLTTDAMKRTPSFARAQEDIHGAEDSSGGVGKFNSAVGGAVALAPLGGPMAGAVRGGLAPLVSKLRGGIGGKMAEGAWRGLTKSASPVASEVAPAVESAAPKVEGLMGNDVPESRVLDLVRRQPATEPAVQAVDQNPWRPRHRTNAQFEHFAEQMAKRRP